MYIILVFISCRNFHSVAPSLFFKYFLWPHSFPIILEFNVNYLVKDFFIIFQKTNIINIQKIYPTIYKICFIYSQDQTMKKFQFQFMLRANKQNTTSYELHARSCRPRPPPSLKVYVFMCIFSLTGRYDATRRVYSFGQCKKSTARPFQFFFLPTQFFFPAFFFIFFFCLLSMLYAERRATHLKTFILLGISCLRLLIYITEGTWCARCMVYTISIYIGR